MNTFEAGIKEAAARAGTRWTGHRYATATNEVIRASRIGTRNEDVRETAARLNLRHGDVHRAIAFEHLPEELRAEIVADFRTGMTALHICDTYGCSSAAVQHCLRSQFDTLQAEIATLRGAV